MHFVRLLVKHFHPIKQHPKHKQQTSSLTGINLYFILSYEHTHNICHSKAPSDQYFMQVCRLIHNSNQIAGRTWLIILVMCIELTTNTN